VTLPAISSFVNTAGGPLSGLRMLTLLRTVLHLRHGRVLADALSEIRPHLVHVNEWFYLQAVSIADRAGLPVVLHARSAQDREVFWASLLAEAFIERHTDVMVSIDASVQRSLSGVRRSAVVYNPLPTSMPEIRRSPNPDHMRVTYITGLMSQKGVDDLVECALLLRKRRDIVFTVYGANPRPQEFYRSLAGRACSALGITRDAEADLHARVAASGLSDTLRLAGEVSAESDVFSKTDVLVFPSRMNGVGRSVFEAGIHGIPSVVSLKNRIEDIVEDGRNGLIVPERNPSALAGAIARLADHPEERERLGAAARAQYAYQFNPGRAARQMLDVYRAALERRGRRQ
jgi:glycosyltransferase involved in cell wall biosynthesis